MFCRNCGKQLDDNAIICPQCGVEVNPTNSTGYSNRNYNNNQSYNNQANNQGYNNQSYNNQGYNNQGYYNRPNDPYRNGYNPGPYRDTSNTIAIVGFVLSFFFAIAGLICSIIGYNRAKNEGLENKGFALAGIIISILEIGSFLLVFICIICLPALLGWAWL